MTAAFTDTAATPGQVLRPHQQAAFDEASDYLREHSRVTICMPCGTGKTLLGQRLAQSEARHGPAPILVLVPSLSLLTQTIHTWIQHSPRPITALAFCDRRISGKHLGVPATTSPAALSEWMRDACGQARRPTDPQPVVFATYHSSPRIAEAHRDHGLGPFTVAVADEAHRTAGQFEAAFATVVDDTKVLAAVRIFLTATPRVRREDNTTAFCMDSEAAFGRMVMPIPLREAINQGLLSDYEVAVVTVTDDDIRTALDSDADGPPEETVARVDTQLAATQVAVGAAITTYQLSRIMVFHNSVATSRRFAADLPAMLQGADVGPVRSMHLDAATPTAVRHDYLQALAEPGPVLAAVLSNVRCLGEGIDVPALDGIVFAAPRTSAIDITQSVGRALRIDPARPGRAVIVLPVFVDDSADLVHQVRSSRFKHVYRTLLALADQDSALAGELYGRPHPRRRGGRGTPGGRGESGDRGRITVLAADGAPGAEELRAALTLRTLKLLTPGWDFGYQQLQAYAEQHGACPANAYVTDAGYPLGSWARGQRQRREQLTDDQRSRLEAIPGWAWNRFDAAWSESYARLVRWAAVHGDVKIPRGYRTADGFCMDQWPTIQRREYRAGTLAPDRIALLEALPGWSWNPAHDSWDTGYAHLEAFLAETGSACPSQTEVTADGYRLGFWVAAQRSARQLGKLTPERAAALEAIPGWTWNVREARWWAGLTELKRFGATYGHVQVPRGHRTPSGDQLGRWVSNQRVAWRAGQLTPERCAALDAVPGWTWWATCTTTTVGRTA